MTSKLTFLFFFLVVIVFFLPAKGVAQSCPANINFSSGDISNWSAKTGLVSGAQKLYPAPNASINSIPEYSITTTGIKVITTQSTDAFGGFSTIPTINGYSYNYSIQIGSPSTSWDLHTNNAEPGGFTRSVTYVINVPAGSPSDPYTITYAYAMVLENGTHNSNQQPLFKATASTPAGIITCASPSYYLPTFNNATQGNPGGGSGTGATLDSAAAKRNGFTVSPKLFLSHAGRQGNTGTYLQDVWTKGWTEVTFDLSPYRGQDVTLTFEADNCTPGAHFAYAYVALRNDCGGLQISGNPVACTNNEITYSIPSLGDGTYSWTVPAGWVINSGADSNIINVTPGPAGGIITAHEINGCADLNDTISVTTTPPTVPGQLANDNAVCAGTNSTALSLSGQTGSILNWVSSTDGVTWTPITNTTTNYTAQNLNTTTQYKAVVQNGSSCKIDSSTVVTVTVSPQTVGGSLAPASTSICADQTSDSFIKLEGSVGSIVNWQSSPDSINWNYFVPVKSDSVYNVNSITASTWYRVILKSGVCPADTSDAAAIRFINVKFPSATIDPASIGICYGKSAQLNATITNGTSYTWSNQATLTNTGNGSITASPYSIKATASPLQSTDYVLTIMNAGCPNALTDTFHVDVAPPILVFAGNDTSIVAAQPLQLNATTNDSSANIFTWTPSTGLSSTEVPDPVANLSAHAGSTITYTIRATDAYGCYGEDNIKVTVFTTLPDIFVPSGFTPNGDGRNDIIKPICVGITQLNYFQIYNRWGQLVFSTKEIGKGWDGTINGTLQGTSNFVYIAQGVDYTGKTVNRKGNIALIR
ncbi:MAG: gliding motility-associated C-terminal domain-containing protein [Chitinophagaceae bacterium]